MAIRKILEGVNKLELLEELEEWQTVAKKELEKELEVQTEIVDYDYYGNLGALSLEAVRDTKGNNGEREWIVFEDSEKAEEAALAKVKEDLENEPELFVQEWLVGMLDREQAKSFFSDVYDEFNTSYAYDIQSADDDTYTNRLAQEMVERNIISEEEGKDENFDLEDKIEDFVEKMTADNISQDGIGFDYYSDNFGKEEAIKLIFQHQLIDIDAAAQDAIDQDGVAHFLDGYDNEEVELPSGAIAYGTN